MNELGNWPHPTSTRAASVWTSQPRSQGITPRITPSPITESPEEDVFSELPLTATADPVAFQQNKEEMKQAKDFPSSDIIDEINAKMPQLSTRNQSLSSGSSFVQTNPNTSPFTTPSNNATRRESATSISPTTSVPPSGEGQQSVTPTPFDKERAEKRRLVDLIKSGAVFPDDNTLSQTAIITRPRDQSVTNTVQFTPAFNDLGYHATTIESEAFFAYLDQLGGQLSLSDAFTLIPFVEKARMAKPKNWGVIKITNVRHRVGLASRLVINVLQIPYGTTKPEIVAFVGRNARLVPQPQGSPWFAIHIIMDRSTAKTMDCYVEFETQNDANHAVERFRRQCVTHRHPRIGDRHVEVSESSQAALMKELFPRSKCVRWEGQDPHPYETTEPFNSGFNGFTTNEEMVVTIKHAETPQRVSRTASHILCYAKSFTVAVFPQMLPAYLRIYDQLVV
ncbi:MAG: hypothetical protein M1822_005339 [Bathelium mastoideum]|nr:MAG: hypothetical protein M1822_005339 [Bathelium mastoideum]